MFHSHKGNPTDFYTYVKLVSACLCQAQKVFIVQYLFTTKYSILNAFGENESTLQRYASGGLRSSEKSV